MEEFDGYVPAWTVTAYIKTELPITSRVVGVLSLSIVFVGENAPEKAVIEAFVSAQTRNSELLLAETVYTPIPRDLLSEHYLPPHR